MTHIGVRKHIFKYTYTQMYNVFSPLFLVFGQPLKKKSVLSMNAMNIYTYIPGDSSRDLFIP